MIVQAVGPREVNNVNLAADLMKNRDLGVGEEPSFTVKSPYFIDESRLAGVLEPQQAYEALGGQNVPDLVNDLDTLNPPQQV